jgi:hypothetical protein
MVLKFKSLNDRATLGQRGLALGPQPFDPLAHGA